MVVGLDGAIATKSILFIDPTVEDYQTLIGGLTAENRQDACSTKIVILDPYRDGIEQISETLARNKGLKAVHLLSHGGPGCLYLGNSQLSSDTVGRYTTQLRQWGQALGENADILLYGCKVGADLAFVRQLRELTGANIAASATSTGNAALGGAWNLKVTVGEVSTRLAFESAAMAAYNGILDRLFAVKDDGSNLIVELNPSTGVEINSFSFPDGLLATPQGLAFDGNSLFLTDNGSTLFELDPDTGAIRDFDTISGLFAVDGLAVLDRKVYLLDGSASDIFEFDPISDTVTNTLDIDLENLGISVGGGLAGITGPNALLAISNNLELVEINPATGVVTDSFLLPGGTGYGVAAIDNEVYVAYNNGSPLVEVFDRSGASQRIIDNLPWLSALGGDDIPDGILYFSEDSAMDGNGLYSLDTATGASTFLGESGSISTNVGLAPSHDTKSLYGSTPYDLVTVNNDGSGISFIGDNYPQQIDGLAFDYTKEILYGIEGSNFFSLNQNTGNKTTLPSPPTSSLQALAYGNGGVYALGDVQPDLRFYNPNTNVWSTVGDTGQVWPNAGLAFDPFNNALYAKSSDDTFLYQIDPSDATTTQIGDTGSDKGGGLAFSFFQVPPPQEPNDTLTLASYTGLTRSNYGSFNYSGEIDGTSDVDLFHFYLGGGDRLAVTPSDLFDASQQSVGVPEIRIFDASGTPIQQEWSFSPTEDTDYFTAPLSGSYYLGISSTNNSSYDPTLENSGSGSNTGTYDLGLETIETGKQRLFAISGDGTQILELDSTTGTEVNRFYAPDFVEGLAFDGDRLFFINNSGRLWELDPNNGTVIDFDETNIAGSPEGLAVLGGKVYILDSQNKDIIEFNPLTSTVTNTLDIDIINTDVTLLAGGLTGIRKPDALLVTGQLNSSPDRILEIDPATGEITNSFGGSIDGLGLAAMDGEIYVENDSFIEVFNRSGEFQRTIGLPENISGLGSDDILSDEPILYFSRDGAAEGLYSLDVDTGTATLLGSSDSDGSSNVGLAPSSNSELLYGSKPEESLIEINADGSGTNFFIDGFASGLAYDRSRDILYGISNGSFLGLEVSTDNPLPPLSSPPTTSLRDGLAFGNGGVYGLGADQNLWFYDPSTNSWEAIGDTGKDWWDLGLAFDSNKNVLYAKGSQDTFLYQIDVSNAQTTVVGDTGLFEGGGLAYVIPGNTPTEANDTISQASATGLTVDNPGVFTYSGEIGDNNNVAPESDVDLFQFQLDVGEEVQFSLPDVFDETGMRVGSANVRLFDSSGNDLSSMPNGGFSVLLEDTSESKPYGSYTTTEAGTFYLGVSADNNSFYIPDMGGSGSGNANSTGSYSLTIETIGRTMGAAEPNDTLADAVATELTLDSPGSYSYTGEIGDNANILPALDVDLFEFELDVGETVRFNLPQRRDELDNLIAETQVQLFDASGTPITWESDGLDYGQFTAEDAGTFYLGISDFDLNAYDPTIIEGRSAFGNSYVEGGTYDLTIETTTEENMATVFSENFNSFTGSGFAPTPAAGQLDSDNWKVTGSLADGDGTFGGTHDLNDFARGISTGGVSTGGVYAFEIGTGDNILGLQPTDDDYTPGDIVLKVTNNTGSTIQHVNIAYDIFYNNNGDRANSLNFSASEVNEASLTEVLTFTTPEVSDALGWQSESQSTGESGLNIAPGADFYFRWRGDDVSGSGSRDEYGIDNIVVVANSLVAENFTPTDDGTGVAVGDNLVIDFDVDVAANTTGNIVIKKASDGSVVESIPANDSKVSIANDIVTINPTSDLSEGTEYYVEIDAGAFRDFATNTVDYAGISGPTAWNFTTASTDTVISGTNDTLYDGTTGLTPNEGSAAPNGPWLEHYNIFLTETAPYVAPNGSSVQSTITDATRLDTTSDNTIYAGYSNYNDGDSDPTTPPTAPDDLVNADFPALDNTQGYMVNFTIQVNSESNNGDDYNTDGKNDRAGFSTIVVSSDTTKAIELSFETDRIWAQSVIGTTTTDLVQAEGVSLDTTVKRDYNVKVSGDTYTLFADGAPILSGDLRDYTGVNLGNLPNPYLTANGVFLGDRTDDASAQVDIFDVSTTTPTRFDFNSDGVADIFWRNGTTGENQIWLMNNDGTANTVTNPGATGTDWNVKAVEDFSQDGVPDILWRNGTTGSNVIWLMNGDGASKTIVNPGATGTDWNVKAVEDFSQDGVPDILWRNGTTGSNVIWLMNGDGASKTIVNPGATGTDWNVKAVEDFSQDGVPDILWRNGTTGSNVIWLIKDDGASKTIVNPGATITDWDVKAVKDFSQDGVPDILWRNGTTGSNVIWLIKDDGASKTIVNPGATITDWDVKAVKDFSQDGVPDILWRNGTTGSNVIWLIKDDGASKTIVNPGAAMVDWDMQLVEDFSQDGVPDILWRNDVSGNNGTWLINNNGASKTVGNLDAVDVAWNVITNDFTLV